MFLLFGIVAFALWLGTLVRENEALQALVRQYGYMGIFVVAIISGFNIAVPIPAAAFIPVFVESGFSVWPVVGLIALGTTIADLAAFGVGKVGRSLLLTVRQDHIRARLDSLQLRFPWAPMFVLFLFAAFVPLPNELLLVPFAFLGYRVWRILPPLILGNSVFNALAAFGIAGISKIW